MAITFFSGMPAHSETFDCKFKDPKNLGAGMYCTKVAAFEVDEQLYYFPPLDAAIPLQSPPLPPDFLESRLPWGVARSASGVHSGT
jgi:hypothetical protein